MRQQLYRGMMFPVAEMFHTAANGSEFKWHWNGETLVITEHRPLARDPGNYEIHGIALDRGATEMLRDDLVGWLSDKN